MDGIEVVRQDGPARLGILKHGELETSTPEGFYLEEARRDIRRYQIGLDDSKLALAVAPQPGIVRPRTRGSQDGSAIIPAIYRPGEAFTGCRFFTIEPGPGTPIRELIRTVIEAREEISPNAVLMVADADIWSFPLLALSGVDLFGDSHARSSGTNGEMLFESYSVEAGKLGPDSCPCPVCREAGPGNNPLGHNRWMMSKVLAEMRNRISIGEIKLMVEERATGHPEVSAALKGLYRDHGEYLEKHTTVVPGVRR